MQENAESMNIPASDRVRIYRPGCEIGGLQEAIINEKHKFIIT